MRVLAGVLTLVALACCSVSFAATKAKSTSGVAYVSATHSEGSILFVSGDFKDSFYAFMLQLEQLPRLTRVSKMDLKKISERNGQMEAQVTLSIFFEPETGGPAMTTASTN